MKYTFDITEESENNYKGYISIAYNDQIRNSVKQSIAFTVTNNIVTCSESLYDSLIKLVKNVRLTVDERTNATKYAEDFVKYCGGSTNTTINTTTNNVVAL